MEFQENLFGCGVMERVVLELLPMGPEESTKLFDGPEREAVALRLHVHITS